LFPFLLWPKDFGAGGASYGNPSIAGVCDFCKLQISNTYHKSLEKAAPAAVQAILLHV